MLRTLSTRVARLAGSAALVAALATPAHAQWQFYSTGAYTNTLDGLGLPGVPVIGQTFVLPAGFNYLQRFSLFLGEAYNGANLRFDAAVYEYGTNTVLRTAATGVGGSSNVLGLTPFTFQTTNLLLDPTKTYAFLLTATSVADADPNGARNVVGTMDDPNGIVSGDVYAGGTLVGGDDALNLVELPYDASFAAVYTVSAVPEPATFALVGGGLALVGVVARRRRRA